MKVIQNTFSAHPNKIVFRNRCHSKNQLLQISHRKLILIKQVESQNKLQLLINLNPFLAKTKNLHHTLSVQKIILVPYLLREVDDFL